MKSSKLNYLIPLLLLLAVYLLAVNPPWAMAQDSPDRTSGVTTAAADAPAMVDFSAQALTPPEPSNLTAAATAWWALMRGDKGWIAALFAWGAALRLGLKFFSKKLQETASDRITGGITRPGSDHDVHMQSLLRGTTYRGVTFALDLIGGIKLPSIDTYLDAMAAKFPAAPVVKVVETTTTIEPAKPIAALVNALALACLLAFSGGCTTAATGTMTFDLHAATNAIQAAVPAAVRLAVTKWPDTRLGFQSASVAIAIFVQTNSVYDPAALNAVLAQAEGTALTNADVQAAVDAAVGLYRAYYGDVVAGQLDKVKYLVPLLQSLGSAMQQGLEGPSAMLKGSEPETPLATKIRLRDGNNYLGVWSGMIAEFDGCTKTYNSATGQMDGPARPQGVMMYSATSGELLKWIGYDDFVFIFVDKTKPEYPRLTSTR